MLLNYINYSKQLVQCDKNKLLKTPDANKYSIRNFDINFERNKCKV